MSSSNGSAAAQAGRINVLFVIVQMAMGGSERLVLNLIKRLDTRTFAPSVAWLVDGPPTREFTELGIPLFPAPKRKSFDWSAMRRIAAIVREERIDVVNAHHFLSFVYAYYGTKVANRAGLIYTEHSEADVLGATGKWRAIGSLLLRSCDAAVGISEQVTRTMGRHFGVSPSRLLTITNGVDVNRIGAAAGRRDVVRRQLGIGDEDIVIGHVANFRRNKNHLFLLRAFREVARRDSRARLVLAGQGFAGDPENSEAEARAFVAGNHMDDIVRFLGYQSDVEDVIGAFDIGCLVSYNEGLPLSVVEYMAAGLPVVGTNIDAISHIVAADRTGLLVTPDDVPGLSRALLRLIDDASLRIRMGVAAREVARTQYALTRCVDETSSVLTKAATDLRRTRVQPAPSVDNARAVHETTR